jgi:DNA oxidative demethylase
VKPIELGTGIRLWPERLDAAAQSELLREVLAGVAEGPFFKPTMPGTGKPFSVEMTNFGPLGWVSDQHKGYRYEPIHPLSAKPWPRIPESLLALWADTTGYEAPPEACLVNFYRPGARMGLHRDADEAAMDAPVLSISLGASAIFRFGEKSKTKSLKLASGDVLTFGGPARLIYHGIDRILVGSSSLIPGGGRINLTLRRVTPMVNTTKKTAGQGADRPSNAL